MAVEEEGEMRLEEGEVRVGGARVGLEREAQDCAGDDFDGEFGI